MARTLGIDIGAYTVRGAVLRTALRRAEVEQYVEQPLAPATDPAGRAEAQREAVAALLAALPRPPDRVIASLDGREASLRIVSLPAGAARRAAEVLPFELEALIPFPLDSAVIDHQPVKRTPTEIQVLAAAVPKEKIATRLGELADAGIDPRELAVGAAALDGLTELLPALASTEATLIVDVSENETDLCLVRAGHCEMARTLSVGIAGAASGALEAEIKRTLVAHRASGGEAPVRVLLAGDVAADPGAAEWLESRLELPVSQTPLPPAPGVGEGGIGRFARAAALAARSASRAKRLDLRQGEFAPVRAGGELAKHARLVAICGSTLLLAFVFSIWARWAALDAENEALVAELGTVTEQAFGESADTPARARDLLERGPRSRDPMPKFDAYDVLDAISHAIPEDITHNTRRLHIELDDDGHGGRFELQGSVASVAERDRIADQLAEHECIGDIEEGRTSAGPGGEGLNYQLEAPVRCPGAPAPEESSHRRRRD